MPFLRPLPASAARLLSVAVVVAWIAAMSVLVQKSYLQASSATLAADLARYGSDATWRGGYYRGEKIGFTVGQTVPTADGFELQEDGRMQMALLGAATAATLRTTVRVDASFALQSFEFSLDPGTGPTTVHGTVARGATPQLIIDITSPSGTRRERRDLDQVPVLSQNFSRLLANGRLTPGSRQQWAIFDPATLRNAMATVVVGEREVIRNTGERPVPAFRVDMAYQELRTTSWITDTGEVVREESPLGLMTVRESAGRAQSLAVPGRVQTDLLAASAVVPELPRRLDEPRDVRRMRLEVSGATLAGPDLQGAGQSVVGSVVELVDARRLAPGPRGDEDLGRYLTPEPLIESDDPEIVAEAERALRGVDGVRARAERLTRHVNAILEKKPTVSLPSAREVLRTRVGDCNEHTALYVAMARAVGIPARIAVGLVYVRGLQGAFYYHAWPEVYIAEEPARGLWLPVDPTLNEFPADATHLRLARGGLDRQTSILPLIGRLRLNVIDLELDEAATPILVGRPAVALAPLSTDGRAPAREATRQSRP